MEGVGSLRGKGLFQRQGLVFYEAAEDPRIRNEDDGTIEDLPVVSGFSSEEKDSLAKIQAGARGLLARKQQEDGTGSNSNQVDEEDLPTWSASSSDDPARLTKIKAGAKGLLARKQRGSLDRTVAVGKNELKALEVADSLAEHSTFTNEDTASSPVRLERIQAGARGLLDRSDKSIEASLRSPSSEAEHTVQAPSSEVQNIIASDQADAVANHIKRLQSLLETQAKLLKAREKISADICSGSNVMLEIFQCRKGIAASQSATPCLSSMAKVTKSATSSGDVVTKQLEADLSVIDFSRRERVLVESVDILQHAPSSLLSDEHFLLEAVKRNAGALKYADKTTPELDRLAARRLRFQRLSGADIEINVEPSDTVRDAIDTIARYLHCMDASCIKLVLDGRILEDEDLASIIQDLCLDSFSKGGVGLVQVIQMARTQTQEPATRTQTQDTAQQPDDASTHGPRRSIVDINRIGINIGESLRPRQTHGQLHVLGRFLHARNFEDDYEISRKELGQGVSGSVVQAWRRNAQGSDDVYAVKSLSLQNVSGASLDVLKGELEVFLSADHPHIVRLVDVYESSSCIHFVMECMKGGELFDRIIDNPTDPGMSEEDARELVRQMLLAVNYLHTHSIVHRDLKPENFLFDSQGSKHLKMIDFGFSKFVSKDELMHECLGTWAYCAPEVFTREYTTQCDMWSIGVTFFVMLFGCMPFNDETGDLYQQVMNGLVLRPPKWYVVSVLAIDFLEQLVAVNPAERLTAWQALCHPFIYECGSQLQHTSIEVVNAFRKFTSLTKLQKSSLEMLSWSLSSQERARVEEAFLAIDTDMSGTISVSELRDFLIAQHYMGEGEFAAVAQSLDYNGDGEICYSEFLASMCSSTIRMRDHNLRDAFRRFDVDGSGYISSGDLLQILGDTLEEAAANELIAEADTDADREISFEEFEAMIKNVSSRLPDDASRLFVSGQITRGAWIACYSWIVNMEMNKTDIRISACPFNLPTLPEATATFPNGIVKLDVPCFGGILDAVMEIFSITDVSSCAKKMNIRIPEYKIDTFLKGKMQKVRDMVDAARVRIDCVDQNLEAVARLESFANDFEGNFEGIHENSICNLNHWKTFVGKHVASGWENNLAFEHVLGNFGFDEVFAASLRDSEAEPSSPKPGTKEGSTWQYEGVRWVSKALGGYKPVGCLTDVVNLVFAMMSYTLADVTLPQPLSEDRVIEVIKEFKRCIDNKDLHKLWIPNYVMLDCESDDMLLWCLLAYVHGERGTNLFVLAQLPEHEDADQIADYLRNSLRCEVFRDCDSQNLKAIMHYWKPMFRARYILLLDRYRALKCWTVLPLAIGLGLGCDGMISSL